MWRWTLIVLVVLAAVLGMTVGALNPQIVAVDLLAWRMDAPLGAALIGAFVIGLAGGFVLALLIGHVRRKSAPRSSSSGGVPSLEHE